MLKIIGRKNSSNVQKALWCCAELGIDYEREDAGREFGRNDTAEFLAMNPNGTVPVIDDDGCILWESNTIVRYLAARHGMGTLCPEDLRVRAGAERWMDWQLSVLGPAFSPIFHGLVRDPPEKRDHAKIATARDNVESKLEMLDRTLGDSAFVAGDDLTIGDIPVGIYAYRWYAFDIERKTLPNLERWYAALSARPAFQTHVMVGLA
ncbi:MAG: glutathione S-transferase family protein [Alphaproteobacteria bacterium]